MWLPSLLGRAQVAATYVGISTDYRGTAPQALWVWVALTGLAGGVAVLGWTSARWWRRAMSLLARYRCPRCAPGSC